MVRSRDPQSPCLPTYSCASGETSPPETAGGSRRRLTAKRGRLILPTYVNRICHDYTRDSGENKYMENLQGAWAQGPAPSAFLAGLAVKVACPVPEPDCCL